MATDSRGKGWRGALESCPELPDHTRVLGYVTGGAKLRDLFQIIKKEARRENYYYPNNQIIILLSGGICDITSKERGQVIFNDTVDTDKFQNIKEVLDNIWQYCEENTTSLPDTEYTGCNRKKNA